MTQQSSPEANEAYRQFLCKNGCGRRYAPGMPWCYGYFKARNDTEKVAV